MKKNFGSQKAMKASKLIKQIESEKDLKEKEVLKSKIEQFLNLQKTKSFNFSKMKDKTLCILAYDKNKNNWSEKPDKLKAVEEAKKRNLDCSLS